MDNTNYDSKHTGPEIDAAIDRAKAGGEIDTLLAGKAPDGFGLGGASVSFSDANDCVKNGFYRDGSGTALNTPFSWCHLLVTNFGADYVRQDAFAASGNGGVSDVRHSVRIKHPNLGGWGQWEWESGIPMQLGVEYRTTERYQGKPVYVKLVDFGALPNSTTKRVDPSITDFSKLVDMRIMIAVSDGSYHVNMSFSGDTSGTVDNRSWFKLSGGGIVIKTFSNQSANSAIVSIKYTKTTD